MTEPSDLKRGNNPTKSLEHVLPTVVWSWCDTFAIFRTRHIRNPDFSFHLNQNCKNKLYLSNNKKTLNYYFLEIKKNRELALEVCRSLCRYICRSTDGNRANHYLLNKNAIKVKLQTIESGRTCDNFQNQTFSKQGMKTDRINVKNVRKENQFRGT